MRLFFGITLSPALISILGRTQERLLRSIPVGFAPASLEQLHLTLHFLGERPEEELQHWKETLHTVNQGVPPFEIALRALGAFPHPKEPRVVWAGIEDTSGSLQEIVTRLRSAAEKAGCPIEEREFVPHLTLGRNKVAKNAIALRLFLEREKLPAHREPVSEVLLYQSIPSPNGHRYSVVSCAPLT